MKSIVQVVQNLLKPYIDSNIQTLTQALTNVNDGNVIATATDFNTLTSGKYIVIVNGNSNSPSNDGGTLIVSKTANGNSIKQIFMDDTGNIYERYYYNSTWSSWRYPLQNNLQQIHLSYSSNPYEYVENTSNGYGSMIIGFSQQNTGTGLYALNAHNGNLYKQNIIGVDNSTDTYFHNEFTDGQGLKLRLSSAKPYDTSIVVFKIGL